MGVVGGESSAWVALTLSALLLVVPTTAVSVQLIQMCVTSHELPWFADLEIFLQREFRSFDDCALGLIHVANQHLRNHSQLWFSRQ